MQAIFKIFGLILALLFSVQMATAQQRVWIQIEAQPSLREAEDRARDYAGALQSVNGFALGSGWYGIALGPFAPQDADATLRQLRAARQIPSDSFIADGRNFRLQFWPVGGAQAAMPAPDAPATPNAASVAQPIPALETPTEARRAEAQLTREDRAALQVALQWAGFYNGAIDAAFGPGTRNSMAEWQAANNFEVTGILTTRQRGLLLQGYQDVLDALAMRPVTDDVAGIAIDLPSGLVEFDRYDPPFAQYRSKDDSGVRVLLISQTGDVASLGGLYDIMQTLEIVPLEGARDLGRTSFTLTGENTDIVSHTYAELSGGHIKGFMLIWPAGDEKRRALALDAMKASFTPTDGVLPDAYGDTAMQSIDLLAGLEIRSPDATATGFYVDDQGLVLTTSSAVAQCARITLGDESDAEIAATNGALALLRPVQALAPMGVARFQPGVPRLNSEIAISGYSYGGRLGAPTLAYGTLAELQGLDGSDEVMRLALTALPGDAGAPVYDTRGAVLGMLLPTATEGRVLPENVSLAADMEQIVTFLASQGVSASAAAGEDTLAPEDLIRSASDMTVLVSCWN